MAGRVEMQPLFTRRVNGLLGNLAGDKGINTEARGAVDKALPAPGAPGNAFYQVRARIAAPQRATPQASSGWKRSTSKCRRKFARVSLRP